MKISFWYNKKIFFCFYKSLTVLLIINSNKEISKISKNYERLSILFSLFQSLFIHIYIIIYLDTYISKYLNIIVLLKIIKTEFLF